MTYNLLFTRHAKKQLTKLPRANAQRIVTALSRIRIRPHAYVKRLVASPYYSFRVGKYRVILDIKAGQLLILYLEKRDRVYG